MSDIEEFSGGRVLEKLEAQIQAMEMELAEVNANIEARKSEKVPSDADFLVSQAKALDAETQEYNNTVPELDTSDKGVEYFLAVGALEKEIADLKVYGNIVDKRLEDNNLIIGELKQDLAETKLVIDKVKALAAEKQAERSKMDVDSVKATNNLQLENNIRATKKVTSEFKSFLKDYINKIGTQEEGILENHVPLGILLQELWLKFFLDDKDGWIKLEELDFDVREGDVAKLLACEIIQQRKEDMAIQLVDFTMRY
eukprot:TRINITY_DN7666_c0_g1_i1.p1 TRINITY_DN7666_c0_g1~~TRINITY_DN7666_c0_g1_i1.p1  ORF type:complete len:276 (-),score=87.96 TRINITY_DN7666_c0_g1_i1:438-1205(-)